MTDFTREEILELVDGRIRDHRHSHGFTQVGSGADISFAMLIGKYEHLRQIVEQANPELFKGEK